MSALMLRLTLHSVGEIFRRRPASRIVRMGIALLHFASFGLMSLMAFGIPYGTLVGHGDAMGGAARWLIFSSGLVGAVVFASTQLTDGATSKSRLDS